MINRYHFIFLSYLIFFTFTLPSIAKESVISLNDNQQKYILSGIEFFEDKTNKIDVKDIISDKYSDSFKINNKDKFNFGFSDSTYWLKIKINNKSSQDRWILDIGFPNLANVDLYYFKNNKLIEKNNGLDADITKKDIHSRSSAFNLIF